MIRRSHSSVGKHPGSFSSTPLGPAVKIMRERLRTSVPARCQPVTCVRVTFRHLAYVADTVTRENMAKPLVLPVGIEPTTSPLPRECSTTELRQRPVRGPSPTQTQANTRGAPSWQGRGIERPPTDPICRASFAEAGLDLAVNRLGDSRFSLYFYVHSCAKIDNLEP
jgi:hypothetical protein